MRLRAMMALDDSIWRHRLTRTEIAPPLYGRT